MPKLKTRKSAAKRVKRTKSGRFKRFKAGGRHLLTHKPAKRKRTLHTPGLISEADQARMEKMVPYA